MANLNSNRAVNDSMNIDINPLRNKNINHTKLSSPKVDKNSLQSPSNSSDKFMSNSFKIVHQNIRGIFYKTDEFVTSIADTSPHVVCLTEHHLQSEVVQNINLGQYTLGAQFCRQSQKQGGVLIFVSNNIQFHTINLDHFNR
jgi:hypothetical protein